MKRVRILIADADESYTSYLMRHFSSRSNFEIIGTARDGFRALQMIRAENPDIVLMDLLLPRVDGLTLMNQIMSMDNPPFIICLTEFYSHSCIEAARRHGAAYFLFKSVDTRALESVLSEYGDMRRESVLSNMADQYLNSSEKIKRRARDIVRSMGFVPKYNGSSFLTESVLAALKNPSILSNLSAGLYPEIAEKMHSSTKNVERCIRTAITAANADGKLSALLGCAPTNKACIQYILSQVKMQPE